MNTPWINLSAPPALASDALHVWRARLETTPATLAASSALLSDAEQARAERFAFARDHDCFVAAHGLLRKLLGTYLDIEPAALVFDSAAYGKPFLTAPAHARGLQFNLAHSGELALVALAWERRVGVDVEQIRDSVDFMPLAQSHFSPDEITSLVSLSEGANRIAFFNGWARKEAFIKALGEGLSHPLDSFTVTVLPNEPALLRLPDTEEPAEWRLYALDAGLGYAAAVVSEGDLTLRCFAA